MTTLRTPLAPLAIKDSPPRAALLHTPPPLGDARWLVRLRWVALLGQLATLGALRLIGATDLRMAPLLTIEAIILASNLLLFSFRQRAALRGPSLIAPVLILDTFLLTALLAFSGGPMNPYTIFFLVHVVMAAVLLGGRGTWLFVLLCGACYASLFVLQPVSPHYMHGDEFASHLYGMLSSFVIASVCVSYFVLLIQRERQRAENRAADARQAAARAESFAALTAVAAGAAHELATPLGTIAVAARELERAAARLPDAGQLADDARLIREEVDRCRVILDALSPPYPGGEETILVSPQELIASLVERLGAGVASRVAVESAEGKPLRLPRQRTTQAAAALLQNALDSSARCVRVQCHCDSHGLTFRVDDDGEGMSAALQARLGEPFFTTKPNGRGLGLFLVRQFVEHAGGRLLIESREANGTRVTMVVPGSEDAR